MNNALDRTARKIKNMKLTEHQVNFFNTFGYLAIPGMFSPSEVEWIIEEFEISIQEFGGGKDHDGNTSHNVRRPDRASPSTL